MSVKTIENMVEWVETNIKNEPTLKQMSGHVGYSCYYCSTKFHDVVGVSFKEYVILRKLTLAANDLRDTNCKIIDIAIKYGFSSGEAFSRAFYKRVGYTPSRFRKELPQLIMYEKPIIVTSTL